MENKEGTGKKKTNTGFLIGLIIILSAGGFFGFRAYEHSQDHESTDDAQITANVTAVIPRIGGFVRQLYVKDNQAVRKGDTLLILDDSDFRVKVAQAEAALENAKSALLVAESVTRVSEANAITTHSNESVIDAQIEAAKVQVWRTSQDYNRYANLIKDHSITEQQFEQASAAKQSAEKQLQVLKQQKAVAVNQFSTARSQTANSSSQISPARALIKEREAQLEAAKINLSYTVVTAPADGDVGKVSIQPGQLVQAGQSLFNIVDNASIWVVANFKETQIEKMREGQSVEVDIDAYPGQKFEGKIASFSPATGSTFSLLPPDNSSGNFVKTVARIPVKIEFAKPYASDFVLRPGMNVTAEVDLVK